MGAKFLPLLFPLLFLSFTAMGCAELLEDYSYSSGTDTQSQDASESGSRDPFKDYGAYGPSSSGQ